MGRRSRSHLLPVFPLAAGDETSCNERIVITHVAVPLPAMGVCIFPRPRNNMFPDISKIFLLPSYFLDAQDSSHTDEYSLTIDPKFKCILIN